MLQISDLASRTYAASKASRRQTCLTFPTGVTIKYAPVAELADALDLGSVLYVILCLITVFAVFIYED